MPVTVGDWNLFALTRNGSTYTFYENGASLGSVTDTQAIPVSSAALTIGEVEGAGFFDGRMQDVEIFDRALSDSEIAQLANHSAEQQLTSIILTPSTTSSTYGDQVTFTANVSPERSGIPTGRVTFYEVASNGSIISQLGSSTLDTAGIATLQTSTLSAGTHYLAAAFTSDDSGFTDSPLSAPVMLTVAKASARIAVTGYSLTYDGNVHAATGTATGVFGESLSGLDLSTGWPPVTGRPGEPTT